MGRLMAVKRDPWPFPEDTLLERSRRIALSYRSALLSIDPEHCRRLDDRAVELGQSWVRPLESEITDLDEELTADQIGELFTIDPRTVRMWGYRSHIKVRGEDGKPLYRLGDVIDYMAKARQARRNDKAASNA